ncbi:MAG: hypothetical protein Kow0069_25520 [Promethearchaeota archaeon]
MEKTSDYLYALVPLGGEKWKELVLMLEDDSLEEHEMEASKAFLMLMEEIEKGLPGYVEDFKVLLVREFKEGLEGKPDDEKIRAVIDELLNNPSKYSANLPVVKKEQLGDL